MNRRSLLVVPAAALAVLGIGLTAQAASAAPGQPAKGAPAHAATGAQAASSKTPPATAQKAFPGYQQITSALLSDPARTQVSGTASCPAGNRLVGGGAIISSSSLAENINASVPLTDGLTWKVYVNNSSSTPGTFRVYANCVAKVPAYSVVVGTGVSNPAGTQTSASVSCPSLTFPLGGGGFASSGSTAVDLNTSIPLSHGWRTDVNNASTGGNTATAYVICGKKSTAWVQTSGTATTVNPNTQASAFVACPTGTTVFSGGAFSSSGSTSVNLNSTAPSGATGWISYENNASTSSNSVTSYAICGKTTT